MDIQKLLTSGPRTRSPLTERHQKIYVEEYKKTRTVIGKKPFVSRISSFATTWMHRRVASIGGGPLLEIGAGTLNHLRFEPPEIAYDIVEPFTQLYEDNPDKARLRTIFNDIRDIPVAGRKYKRIVSVATFEHLTELPFTIARSGLLLEPGGYLQIGIPSEGGLAWGLAWRLTTGLAYRLRTGLDYKTLIRHEHVNQAREIVALCRYFFANVKQAYFPLPGIHFSLFIYLECSALDLDKCRAYGR